MLFYHQSVDDTYAEFHSGPDGISRHEASNRLHVYGPNAIKIKGEPLWRALIEPFANVFMLVLFIAAIISFIHHAPFDGIIIISIMMISALIYYVQRFSTERVLRSLQKRSSQLVEVTRGSETLYVDASELVPGDIVTLAEGDKIPADIRLVTADSVRVDEAMLTGESEAVSKSPLTLPDKKEVYEQTNMLFQGSFIISGNANGIVVFTGNQTEFGRIAELSKKSSDDTISPVQKKIDRLLVYIVIVVASLAGVAFVLALLRGIEFTEALRFVLAMTVSAVPEGLPVAISVILVLGMRRMTKKKALVRSMQAIETIGVITTIATDKTGTLTENKLSVQEIWQPEHNKHSLHTTAYRTITHQSQRRGDPLDTAISQYVSPKHDVDYNGESVSSLPFNQAIAMSGNVWQEEANYILVVKGAPEQILGRSHLSKAALDEAEIALTHLTSQGYRVIALATKKLTRPIYSFQEMDPAQQLEFVGFLAIADTIRRSSRKAIHIAQQAGVTVRMITGDHFETAFHIAKKLGLANTRDQVFDSRLMDELSEQELADRIQSARVFSRVTPENKFRILKALKEKEITAMTGDGVNDVPALANAHVGIAMGSGSQIAKDAGAIILLNDNFDSIVSAMKEGRIVFANVRRMLFYLLSSNTAEALIMVVALIIGLPLPLLPVQILWVNLVSETAVVIPLGLEPGEKRIMRQKPVSPSSPLLSKYMVSRIFLVAVTMTAVTLSLYAHFNALYGVSYGQTIVFTSIVVMVWANAFNARSTFDSAFKRIRVWSGAFFVGLSVSITLQVLAVLGPLQGVLHVHPIALGDVVITSVIAFSSIIFVVEVHKFFGRHFIKNS
ncbi:MAG: pacL2 [Candidatus Saccharibacteria bacterium]|nr:pacL2 [Candidatus Saccharibacteria bacterium]